MKQILMPKSTAVWLVDNTALTFEQIAEFCSMHIAEVAAIADGQAAVGLHGTNPVELGQLTTEEIKRCEQDKDARLELHLNPDYESSKLVKRYTPIKKRRDRLHAILWIIQNHPEISDNKICKLLSTTKRTIEAIRDGSHKDFAQLTPRSPVLMELCSEQELQEFLK